MEQVVDDFMMMYMTDSVEEWGQKLTQADIASLPLSMCGFFSGALTMVLDDQYVDKIVEFLLKTFHT